MRVLIACEYSGTVRNQFALRGHDAWSCDLLPGEQDIFKQSAGAHYQGSVFDLLYSQKWDLMIGHPPCTYLSYCGTRHWNKPGREDLRNYAAQFFMKLWSGPVEKICLENPLGVISRTLPYQQIVNPFQFGEPYRKRTCLWLKNLPLLVPTNVVEPLEFYNKMGNKKSSIDVIAYNTSTDRRKSRSKFWQGIAAAMADQWG